MYNSAQTSNIRKEYTMSSIPKINGIGKVKFAKFQANESTTSPRVFLNAGGADSFTPSFKSKAALAGKAKTAVPAMLAGLMGALALTNQSCCKNDPPYVIHDYTYVNQEVHVDLNQDQINEYLAQLVELMQENNAQNAAYQAQIIQILADAGVDIQTIIGYLANIDNNGQQMVIHLSDLVQNSQEIKELVANIEAIAIQYPQLMEENNQLLSQILAVALHLDSSNNANQEAIIALLNQLLAQVAHMDQQQAENFAAILEAMNHMNEQMQAQLLAILNSIQDLDANVQAGFQALLAQLQGMSQTMQAQLLAILNSIQGLGEDIQAMFNQFMSTFNQFSQEIQAKLAAILTQMQNMQAAQQEQFLAILNQLHNMQEAQQEQYINILNQLQNLDPGSQQILLDILAQLQAMHATQQQQQLQQEQQYLNLLQQLQNMQEAQQQQFLAIIAQMQQMEAAQQQQYLNLMNLLTQMHGENQANLLAILSQMVNMQDAQEQQYLNLMAQLQNMQADAQSHFLAFMTKLTNLENGQQAILDAMQGMNAEFLAKFTEALAKLDTIEANQTTQISQLAQIYAAIQNGNAHLGNIEDLIRNLNINPNVNLDVIEGLLAEILASQNTGNNLLAEMNDNISFILTVSQTLQAQMAQVTNNQEILADWAENIFNKIPEAIEGCNCGDCCAQIIEILIQIDEHIQELDWNHEGIDDDLDPLLG